MSRWLPAPPPQRPALALIGKKKPCPQQQPDPTASPLPAPPRWEALAHAPSREMCPNGPLPLCVATTRDHLRQPLFSLTNPDKGIQAAKCFHAPQGWTLQFRPSQPPVLGLPEPEQQRSAAQGGKVLRRKTPTPIRGGAILPCCVQGQVTAQRPPLAMPCGWIEWKMEGRHV